MPPPCLRQGRPSLDAAGTRTGNIAGHPKHLGVVIGFDDHTIVLAQPAESRTHLRKLIGNRAACHDGADTEKGKPGSAH